MESGQYQHEALKKCVGLVCQSIGFQGICAMPLEVLTDLLHRYLREIAVLTHNFAEHDNRTLPTVDDLRYAFHEMKVSLPELEEFTSTVDTLPFPDDVPKLPLPRTSQLNFLKPGSREILSRPLHIHEHLPPMLPDTEEGKDGEASGSPSVDQNGHDSGRAELNGVADNLVNGNSSPSRLSAFLSSAQRQRVNQYNEQTTPNGAEGEGEPLRDIDSVMMTTSGFITSSREGKLPDAKLPDIPLPVIPNQASTSRSSGSSNRSNNSDAASVAQAIAAKKKQSLERLMRHKQNAALKRAAENALSGVSGGASTPASSKNKSSKKSHSHSAVLSMAAAAVDSNMHFTTKHGKSKDKLKPKIPATPPGTNRFLTPGSVPPSAKTPGLAKHGGSAASPMVPPPKLKIPTPRQKQPEFSTDVLPLPKEDPKEQKERELQMLKKKEKQKELARAAKSGMLGAMVAGGGEDLDVALKSVVAPDASPSRRGKGPSSSSLLSDALKGKKEKKEKDAKKDLKKISKEARKEKDKKDKDKSDGKKDKLTKKKEEKEKKEKKELKKKLKDPSKKPKDIKKDKDKKNREGKVKIKEKEKKDKKLKKSLEIPGLKSPKVEADIWNSPVGRDEPLGDALSPLPSDMSDSCPDAGKSKLAIFKKNSKSHSKVDSPADVTLHKSIIPPDLPLNVADMSADLSGVISSPSILSTPPFIAENLPKVKKRKRVHDDSDASLGPITPKVKKSKCVSPARSYSDVNGIPEPVDDTNYSSNMSGGFPMSQWEGRPLTPGSQESPAKCPLTPGLHPINPYANPFSPINLGMSGDGFSHLDQPDRPLTPGGPGRVIPRSPDRSNSRPVTPSSCSNVGSTPQTLSSSGPSSPAGGEHSPDPVSPAQPADPFPHSDPEKKKRDKEHKKEKKEKDKLKKKRDKKLKEKLEKKLKEKQLKKEQKKKKKLEESEMATPEAPLTVPPPPVTPKLCAEDDGRRLSTRLRKANFRYK